MIKLGFSGEAFPYAGAGLKGAKKVLVPARVLGI